MRLHKLLGLGVFVCSVWLTAAAWANSPAELLEQGIYHEETVGNLDEAIKIYRSIVAEARETQAIAAQAQLRLGLCLQKQGKEAEAQAAFQEVVARFAEQTEVVAEARRHLPAAVELLAAPWEDGERLTLTMRLASGLPIGLIGLAVDSGQDGDRAIWKMLARRFVSFNQNQGVSQITVDRASNRPLSERWEHSLLGDSNAQWSDNTIQITVPAKGSNPEKTSSVTFDQPSFANDQMFFAFRQLPLAVGYKATVPLRVTFTGGNAVDLTVEVTKKESIEVPAGTFDCFKLETNIAQTFWIADTPQRYLVRFDAQGVIADLTSIGKFAPTRIENASQGFAVTAPAGWFPFDMSPPNRKNFEGLVFVAPDMLSATLKVQSKARLNDASQQSVNGWAKEEVEQIQELYKDARLDAKGLQETTLAGVPAIEFAVELEFEGRPQMGRVLLAIHGEKAIELNVFAPRDQAELSREVFTSIRESITVH